MKPRSSFAGAAIEVSDLARSVAFHRSWLPLQFKPGMTRKTLNLTGHETFDITGIEAGLKPGMDVPMTIHYRDGASEKVVLTCRIDTAEEIEYFKNGGVLQYVLRNLAHAA